MSTPTTEKSSSGFLKVVAFFDLLVKLAATGALFGILVILLRISTHLGDIASGDQSIGVRVTQQPTDMPIGVAVTQGSTAGDFNVIMNNNLGTPVYFKVVD